LNFGQAAWVAFNCLAINLLGKARIAIQATCLKNSSSRPLKIRYKSQQKMTRAIFVNRLYTNKYKILWGNYF
jgi:hypothetical protein